MPSLSILAAAALTLLTSNAMPQPSPSQIFARNQSCSVIQQVTSTFYGYPDNSPPGAGIAYTQCGRSAAGGSGTFSDPVTFATASGEFDVCEVIYAPYLKKYLRYEDECAQCETDWSSGTYHVDTWIGSSTQDGGQDQINCEDNLTPDAQSIIRYPASDLEVDATPLYDNGQCNTDHTYTGYDTSTYCSS
ncbi:hypothetical protein BGW36DRAFT_449889 [Talaromyces proteolyticus]|uniref:Uncharacterized protein n=1 Tax=Talaromyces proteolyticus TaxID=1131652 RepID=A0AAD4PY23_9EURO|nr:uncharacterized protein BGW36DRAFT_449889 [Talaromyces proteolyticus]KAH8697274.1 hypothetical protein BGW36DRAFT_449889 [Talaromyces proteolyticus]